MTEKWRTLLLLALAELLAMSLWFSASAVVPSLAREWALTPAQAGWLTSAVQLGFVAGALTIALTNLADLFPAPRVFAAGALVGAAATLAIALAADSFAAAIALRVLTGIALAAVYPVGMKIMATWTKEDRGLGIGLLVGALTVGSASPHLIRGLGGVQAWRPVLLVASALAVVAALLVYFRVALGPYYAPAQAHSVY